MNWKAEGNKPSMRLRRRCCQAHAIMMPIRVMIVELRTMPRMTNNSWWLVWVLKRFGMYTKSVRQVDDCMAGGTVVNNFMSSSDESMTPPSVQIKSQRQISKRHIIHESQQNYLLTNWHRNSGTDQMFSDHLTRCLIGEMSNPWQKLLPSAHFCFSTSKFRTKRFSLEPVPVPPTMRATGWLTILTIWSSGNKT